MRTAVFGGIGSGATHSQTLEAWLAHIPGLKVVVPSTPADAKGLLTSCIFDDDPCVFIENVALYGTTGPVPEGDLRIPIGSADVKRPGSDVTVVTYGRTVRDALAAAEQLAEEQIDVEVVDLRTLVPLDADDRARSVGRTRRAVVAHHATRFAGFGAEVAGADQRGAVRRARGAGPAGGRAVRSDRLGAHAGGGGDALGGHDRRCHPGRGRRAD